jgi:environmental stress-induced protein Ves
MAEPLDFRVLPAEAYTRTRWANGGGWTREVLRWPAGAPDGAWDWRLSIAEVDRDGPFSRLDGVERVLVLLSGEGMTLEPEAADGAEADPDAAAPIVLPPPHAIARFPGERALQARLHAGPTRDFNLMWRRGRVDAELWLRPVVGAMVFFAAPGERWAVHVVAGGARAKDRPGTDVLEQGDSALLGADGRGGRLILDGAGTLLVMRLAPPGGG